MYSNAFWNIIFFHLGPLTLRIIIILIFKLTTVTRHFLQCPWHIWVIEHAPFTPIPWVVPIGTESMPILLISPHLRFFIRLPMSKFTANLAVNYISIASSFIIPPKKWLSPVQVEHALGGRHSRILPLSDGFPRLDLMLPDLFIVAVYRMPSIFWLWIPSPRSIPSFPWNYNLSNSCWNSTVWLLRFRNVLHSAGFCAEGI